MKQTAVDWLLNEIKAKDWWYLPQSMKQDIVDQALEMEKEQIIEAYCNGDDNISAQQYYNETFKSE